MFLKKYNPTTPGSRHKIGIQKNLLSKTNSLNKIFFKKIKKNQGRSSKTGHITVRHHGGGHKKKYRILFSNKSVLIIISTFYDPYRNSFLNVGFDLVKYIFTLIPAIDKIAVGSLLESSDKLDNYRPGCSLMLGNIPTGSFINSVILPNCDKATLIRAGGTYGQILQKTKNICKIKLPSNKIVEIKNKSFATLGVISNNVSNLRCFGKAGARRILGKRPSTRGIAMNPVDHPHGGRTNGGCHPVSPWGKLTRGVPTRRK